jgi:hypothetical protein
MQSDRFSMFDRSFREARLKVMAINSIFGQGCIRTNGTFKVIMTCKINTAGTGNLM